MNLVPWQPQANSVGPARGWLMLGVGALAASGLFSLLLVASRTPGVARAIPWIDFFHTALVVHVDLSVLIWFLAFAAVVWCLSATPRFPRLERCALAAAIAGTALIVVSPFGGDARPLLNNYVPVLRAPMFLAGLGMFGAGIGMRVALQLAARPIAAHPVPAIGAQLAALTAAVSLLALLWTWGVLPADLPDEAYYETLFWGAGHIVQFTHTLVALIAWLWLADAAQIAIAARPRTVAILFLLAAGPVALVPYFYVVHPVGSAEFARGFTDLMRYGGLCSLPLGGLVTLAFLRGGRAAPDQRPVRGALACSLGLFAAGGILGFCIEGANVVVPAHYHGSIVGVTLAFFGLTYHLLPTLGYRHPARRLATAQPYIYAGGQFLHIAGLAWSGGYGVPRKVAGAAQGLDRLPEIAGMALMGLGGLIAIIGGILFVIVVLVAMRPERA